MTAGNSRQCPATSTSFAADYWTSRAHRKTSRTRERHASENTNTSCEVNKKKTPGTYKNVTIVQAECQMAAVGRPRQGTHESRRILRIEWNHVTLPRLAVPTVHEVPEGYRNVVGAAPVEHISV